MTFWRKLRQQPAEAQAGGLLWLTGGAGLAAYGLHNDIVLLLASLMGLGFFLMAHYSQDGDAS